MNWRISGEPSDNEGGEGDPHQHSFLDVWFPGTPERDHSWLSKGEGGLVCSKPYALLQLQQFWTHTSQRCKVAAKCTGSGKNKHEGQCEGPKLCSNCNGPHASLAKDCPVWQKEKEIQCVCVEKHISFPEASWLKQRCQLWSLEVRPKSLLLPPEENPNLFSVKPH